MRARLHAALAAALLLAPASAALAPAPCAVAVDTTSIAAVIPPTFGAFGWEMYQFMSEVAYLNDTRFARAARGLAPDAREK